MTTMSTPFLDALQPADMRTRESRCAQEYMRIKGYLGVKPLGAIPQEDAWYFYYDLPDGLLELEVCREAGEYTRRVVGLITDPEQIREYLGH